MTLLKSKDGGGGVGGVGTRGSGGGGNKFEGHKHNDPVFCGYRNVTDLRKGLLVSGCVFI
jgi:hypothetical protein